MRERGRDWGGGFEDENCVWRADAARCARPHELTAPAPGSRVRVLDRLNLRAEPGFRSEVLGVAPAGVCLPVREGRAGSDGLWCAVEFQGSRGWVVKVTPSGDRQRVTYTNGCG
jgi:SH3-like domain-containing protein